MTGEQISCMRHDAHLVGNLFVDQDGELVIEAVEKGEMSKGEALKSIVCVWNDLRSLFDEVSTLAEDHSRMTRTLHKINEKVVDAMQGSSRSQIAADWWQACSD